MDRNFNKIQDVLSFFGVKCNEPYYVSSGNAVFQFPKALFRMDFYSFCICTSGTIQLEIENQEYTIGRHGFLLSAPSTIVKFLDTSSDFRMRLLFFEKNFLLKNISNPFIIEKLGLFKNTTFRIITPEAAACLSLLKLLDYLKEKAALNGRFRDDLIRTVIFNLLLEIAELIDTGQNDLQTVNPENKNMFFRFTELVQAKALLNQDVQYYADTLNISNKYLIQLVKKATGKTPHEVIDEALLKEAYVLLGNPRYNITQIAYHLNFSSVSAFGRFFKKYASISPGEYRDQQELS